jgi:hypothetical protein
LHKHIVLTAALVLLAALAASGAGSVGRSMAPAIFASSEQPAPGSNADLLAQRLPRVVYRGGPFLRHLRIVTITFSTDDAGLVTRLEQFGNTIARTSWWRAITEGYCAKEGDCIGEGQPGLSVRLTETLPAQVHAVEISALLRTEARAGRLGAIDANTVLLVYLPKGVGLKDAFVPSYCGDGPRAYHKALRFDDKSVGYAVMPRCSDEAALTGSASHELLELATNPDTAKRGFAFVQSSDNSGFTAAGVEAMDPCGIIAREKETVESGFVVRRAWSNRAAAQGHDPCVPTATDRPYLALVPRLPTVRVTKEGDRVTISMDAAASQPVGEWAVSAFDLTGAQEREQYVDVTLDKTTVTAGQTATLTIILRKQPPRGLSVVGIVSTMGDESYLWPLTVVVR